MTRYYRRREWRCEECRPLFAYNAARREVIAHHGPECSKPPAERRPVVTSDREGRKGSK